MNITYYDRIWEYRSGDPGWIGYGRWARLNQPCQYCGGRLERVTGPWDDHARYAHLNTILKQGMFDTIIGLYVHQCDKCGWWVVQQLFDSALDRNYGCGFQTQAILKGTELGSRTIPTDELAAYLSRHGDNLLHIHHTKMEELVGAVLREHFDCEVIHCGRTGDGGIDLLLIRNDALIPVQVKRRVTRATEGVSVVRELMGVMLRDGYAEGMVVTSADHFSQQAQADVDKAIAGRRIRNFALIDGPRFLAILREHFGSTTQSYREAIPELLGGRLSGFSPSDKQIGHTATTVEQWDQLLEERGLSQASLEELCRKEFERLNSEGNE